jgi:nucleotide-binding universal stress UspA family protein
MFARILLAVDEAHDTARTMEVVTALARAFSSEVTVLHLRERTVTSGATIENESIADSFTFGKAIATRLVADGVRASAVIDSADPSQVASRILAEAEEIGADLIVIGGHHTHTLRERLFGDTGHVLVHGARCPVLLMPTDSALPGR